MRHRRGGQHRLLLLPALLVSMASLASAFQRAFGARSPSGSTAAAGSTRLFAAAAATTIAPADVRAKYEELCKELREIEALQGIQGLLGWDEQTMMPQGAAPARAAQKGALAGTLHEKRTRPALGELIVGLDSPELLSHLKDDFERANVKLSRREWDLETRKTKEMASREAELEAKGYGTWVKAREASDFQAFAPVLQEIYALKGEIAKATRPDRGVYDGNIDAFEVNMRSERLAEIFAALKADLVPLLQRIMASPRFQNDPVPEPLQPGPKWDKDAQVALSKEISGALGFDFNNGRIDVSVHPFTGGSHPTDVRITTRYSDNWSESVSGTVHEVGHALYEQGRSDAHRDLPVSRALSMGAHESQSLIWERMVFQGRAFWDYATPLFHKHFPHTKGVTAEMFHRYINRVQPGLIRVNADEVTYPLHIILRFEIEAALFSGSLKVEDLPAVWNKRMKELLGVDVPSDKEGVLQDVHWGVGAIGYFPSYSLGAMTAAQLYEAAKKEMPSLEQDLAAGRFTPLREWLQAKVHRQGSLPESLDALLVSATGKPLDPKIFVAYLEKKYAALYDLDGAGGATAGKGEL